MNLLNWLKSLRDNLAVGHATAALTQVRNLLQDLEQQPIHVTTLADIYGENEKPEDLVPDGYDWEFKCPRKGDMMIDCGVEKACCDWEEPRLVLTPKPKKKRRQWVFTEASQSTGLTVMEQDGVTAGVENHDLKAPAIARRFASYPVTLEVREVEE